MNAPPNLSRLVDERKILICCGSGGVGKTTTSASIALHAALIGKRAIVCTIDPARRLANSLGLGELGNQVVQVDPARLASAGLEAKGSLNALMLDTKGTFDGLIERYATSEDARKRILENEFYKQMSTTVVGSSDYMAMEKLFELHEEGDYDLIVLDTPPTKHALDFLQAPQRMSAAFDQSTLDVFLKPWADAGKRSLGFLGRAINRVINKVDQVLGMKFVSDLADFFRAFEGMYEGFRGRARRVDALLREEFTGFVVVTSPAPLPLEEASYFCERLREFEMSLDAVIVNRVHTSAVADADLQRRLRERLGDDPDAALAAALAAGDGAPGLEGLLRALVDFEREAVGDEARIAALREGAARGATVNLVPHFPRDVYDLGGLKHIVDHLFREA